MSIGVPPFLPSGLPGLYRDPRDRAAAQRSSS